MSKGGHEPGTGGAGGANPEQRHQLVVDGNAGDVVNSAGWGASVGTITHTDAVTGLHTDNVYNQGLYAQLLIDNTVTQTVI